MEAKNPSDNKVIPVGMQAEAIRQQMLELQSKLDKLVSPPPTSTPLCLDLGCGSGERKRPGFVGVDIEQRKNADGSDGIDVVCDLSVAPWPWDDNSVDEVWCAHMLEHLEGKKSVWELDTSNPSKLKVVEKIIYPRITFFNELYRVLKPGAKAQIAIPHWASCRAYGDMTHEWPPVSEMFWYSLDANWRNENQPHLVNTYTCHFECNWGYSPAPWLIGKNQEYINAAFQQFKEAAQDMICTIVKREFPKKK